MTTFAEALQTSPVMLISGPIESRLAHEFGRPSPDNASFLQLFDAAGRAALTAIYESYLQVVSDHPLPMIIDTPTWRAHPDSLARHGLNRPDDIDRVNGEAVALLLELRARFGLEQQVFVAGVVGPRLDGYRPEGAPDAASAEAYHRAQVEALAGHGVDLLYAPTFPALDELLGLARAFAATGLPYVLGPTLDASGHLADGHSLADAVAAVDAAVSPRPIRWSVGCVHASLFAAASAAPGWPPNARITGIAANGSPLPHEELDGIDHLESDAPEIFADLLVGLHRRGVTMLGGCCGTGDAHLRALARRFG